MAHLSDNQALCPESVMVLLKDISEIHIVWVRLHPCFLHSHVDVHQYSQVLWCLCDNGLCCLVQRGQWTYPVLAAGHLQTVPWYVLGISSIHDIVCCCEKLALLLILKYLSQKEAESTTAFAGI